MNAITVPAVINIDGIDELKLFASVSSQAIIRTLTEQDDNRPNITEIEISFIEVKH